MMRLEWDKKELNHLMNMVRSFPKAMNKAAIKALNVWGLDFVTMMKEDHLEGGAVGRGRNTTDDKLGVHTGALRNSIYHKMTESVSPELEISFQKSAQIIAQKHEYGGTIKPKTAKALAIPLDAVKNPSGVHKYPGPLAFKVAGIKTFILPGTGLIAMHKIGSNGKLTNLIFLYKLMKSVKIPPRLSFYKEWDDRKAGLITHLDKTLSDTVKELHGRSV